jgi:hypothetical protein
MGHYKSTRIALHLSGGVLGQVLMGISFRFGRGDDARMEFLSILTMDHQVYLLVYITFQNEQFHERSMMTWCCGFEILL